MPIKNLTGHPSREGQRVLLTALYKMSTLFTYLLPFTYYNKKTVILNKLNSAIEHICQDASLQSPKGKDKDHTLATAPLSEETSLQRH